jgi:cytochrome c-type biogenesis protein CcsB
MMDLGTAEAVFLIVSYASLWLATIIHLVRLRREGRLVELLAKGMSIMSLALLSCGLIVRALRAGHWPLTSVYEFSLVFVWGILTLWLVLERTTGFKEGGAFILPLAVALGTYALIFLPSSARWIQPLPPALQSTWLQIHVGSSVVAYGAFASACGLGVAYLLKERGAAIAALLPRPDELERYIWRAVAVGFPWMTFTVLSGAIWAQIAWGRYWGWDPKETWALITWLIYALFLHLRLMRAWRGRPLALLAIIGFASVVFTFLGLNWLVGQLQLESLHVF